MPPAKFYELAKSEKIVAELVLAWYYIMLMDKMKN
jgi:hypothetical protein